MPMIDIFNNDAFSLVNMVAAIEKVPFKPSFLGDLNIFAPKPVNTRDVSIEERDGVLSLVQTSPRGAPPAQRTTEKRTAKSFRSVRIAKSDHITADELSGVRAFGSDTELQTVQNEVMRRMSGPVSLQAEIELTWENMRLGAVQGIVTDADGSVLIDWFDAFGISQPSEIAFDLAGANAPSTSVNGSGVLRPFINAHVIRPMMRAAKGAFSPQTQIYALCGDNFYDKLTNHGDVIRTYQNWQDAANLRKPNAFEAFYFGGVWWVNYRGTDDNTTVAINTDQVKFFPVNAPGVFLNSWSPGEFEPVVNTYGIPLLPLIIPDDKRQAFVDIELYSYPLLICTRPGMLLRGKVGA